MATEKQILASRANGAKSLGPITPEGKLRVSQNSRRHGLCAATTVIEGELPESFEALQAEVLADFAPTTSREKNLAEFATQALWRLYRIWELERAAFDNEIRKQADGLPSDRACAAFRDMANKTRILDLLHRYDSRFERQYHRALFQLERQREIRHRQLARAQNGNLPSKPEEHLKPAESGDNATPIS